MKGAAIVIVDVGQEVWAEPVGVLGRVGDRFPLTTPFGVVAVDGTAVVDGPGTPFGMTLRVEPKDAIRIDFAAVGYDEASQTSMWPGAAPSAATHPMTKVGTTNSTDGRSPDTIPDTLTDTGSD